MKRGRFCADSTPTTSTPANRTDYTGMDTNEAEGVCAERTANGRIG
ncbi:MAG: hypothetical protein K0U66_01045 [Gammaproteobacteria bacterium]|nr:hypothetical protein [Gammaproteobacteria bacterium]